MAGPIANRALGILRDPLAHFVILGVVLFTAALISEPGPRREAGQAIVHVTESQAEAIRSAWTIQHGSPPSPDQLAGLIEKAVEDEILYREALRLGLDRDDQIVRRRLAQKLRFLIEGTVSPDEPDAATLQAYFEAHRDRYIQPATISFEHVYLSPDGRPDIRQDAQGLLARLKAGETGLGDPSMVQRRFRGAEARIVDGVMGDGFTGRLADLPTGAWSGPVASAFGLHLVRITDRTPQRAADLAAVEDRVRDDLMADRRVTAEAQMLADIKARYRVTYDPGLETVP